MFFKKCQFKVSVISITYHHFFIILLCVDILIASIFYVNLMSIKRQQLPHEAKIAYLTNILTSIAEDNEIFA